MIWARLTASLPSETGSCQGMLPLRAATHPTAACSPGSLKQQLCIADLPSQVPYQRIFIQELFL